MKKQDKNKIISICRLLLDAGKNAAVMFEQGEIDRTLQLLLDCQQTAINVGNIIENTDADTTTSDNTNTCKSTNDKTNAGRNKTEQPEKAIITLLENYCEEIYQLYQAVASACVQNDNSVNFNILTASCKKILKAVETQILTKKEIVFLPYKASMWDSLESVWREACKDTECDTYVIPIPYFDKDNEGKVCAMHYEADCFPEDVPITSYKEYSLKDSHPEMIYIHNPYDGHNLITTVHPDYYSDKLREYTDELIYIPYFVLGDINPRDKAAVRGMAHFATVPGVVNAHKVIVQSENMRLAYIQALTEWAGEDSRPIWEKKIVGSGSPKIDKIKQYRIEDKLPSEWKSLIYRPDGSRKKIIMYNNSVGALLAHREKMIDKLRNVLDTFYENRQDVVLLWRPHPLIESTMNASCPELLHAYRDIRDNYRTSGWGIYDDTADLDRAVAISDAYYGDGSSVVELFKILKKPIMIQNPDVI